MRAHGHGDAILPQLRSTFACYREAFLRDRLLNTEDDTKRPDGLEYHAKADPPL